MTTSTGEIQGERVQSYLSRLEKALKGIAPEEKVDILREIRAHIVDSAAASQDREGAIDRTLRLLGTPEELAARYSTESMLTRASRSFSPWLLLRTCWRWAKVGVKGTLAFLLALFGYTTAFALTIALFLKPFMPSRVGVWIGPEGFNVGIPAHPEQMHELLGHWFGPVITVVAFAFALGTTQALRWMMRRRSSSAAQTMTA